MKRKQLLGLFLVVTLTIGSLAGQGTLAFAEDNNTLLETDAFAVPSNLTDTQKQKESGTKETQTKADNAESSTEAKTSTDTAKDQPEVKQKTQTQTQEEENGIAVQASDPVINSSAKTITYNDDLDVTVTNANVSSSKRVYAVGKANNAPSGRNCTYIYNGAVNITFDGVTADVASLVPSSADGGFNTYRFNGPVNVTIKNSTIKQFSSNTNYLGVSSLMTDEKSQTLEMKQKLTVNIENSTITTFSGGMIKSASFTETGWPPVKIDSNSSLDGGLEVSVSGKSNISTLIAGHLFSPRDTKESNNQTFTLKGADITVDDSTVGGIAASYGQTSATDRKNDLKVDGDFNVTLKNGATVTALISNGATFGSKGGNICGEVTGTTTFTTDGNLTMTQMRNVDLLKLGGTLTVKPATENTGANMTLPTKGMKINLLNPAQWNKGDVVLSYKYTDGTYPKVDASLVTSSWSDASMTLDYEDVAAEATQQWKFNKTASKLTIKEEDGSTDYGTVEVTPNNPIGQDKLPKITKPGYIIDGWITEDKQPWDIEKDVVTGDVTLHPVWKLDKPVVTLNPEGNVTHVHVGDGLKLTAAASHKGPDNIVYHFTWFKDGQEITNANQAEGVAATALNADSSIIATESGAYSVKVTASDGKLTSEVVEVGPLDITVTPHDFTGEWKKNETSHWHVCTVENCGVTADDAAHTYGDWTVEKEATSTEDGTKVRTCTVCGYQERATIPAKSDDDKKTISVNYSFVSGTEKKDLPSEVLALLPKDSKSYAKGDKVAAIQPEKSSVKVSDGVWKFEGYDANEKPAVSGVTFTGTWKFTKNPAGNDNNKNNNKNNNGQNQTTTITKTTVTNTGAVKTGDLAHTGVWIMLLMLSGMMTIVLIGVRLKKRHN